MTDRVQSRTWSFLTIKQSFDLFPGLIVSDVITLVVASFKEVKAGLDIFCTQHYNAGSSYPTFVPLGMDR